MLVYYDISVFIQAYFYGIYKSKTRQNICYFTSTLMKLINEHVNAGLFFTARYKSKYDTKYILFLKAHKLLLLLLFFIDSMYKEILAYII
jgi:hypothetical protein